MKRLSAEEGYHFPLTGLGIQKLLYLPLGAEREHSEQIHKSSAENKIKSTNTKQQIKVKKKRPNMRSCRDREIEVQNGSRSENIGERGRQRERETDTERERATNNYEQFKRHKDDSFVFCDQNYKYTDRLAQTYTHKHTYVHIHTYTHI